MAKTTHSKQDDDKSQSSAQQKPQSGSSDQKEESGNQQDAQDKQSSGGQDQSESEQSSGKREAKPAPKGAQDSAEENPEQENVNAWTSPVTYILLVLGLIGICIVLYAWRLWPFDIPIESTDDAYIKGNVTTIAPQVSGQLLLRPADDFLFVKAGDLLAQIDDRSYKQKVAKARANLETAKVNLDDYDNNVASKKASLDLAQAQLASADANMVQAQLDLARISPLESTGVASHATGDAARVKLSEAQASVSQAKANVEVAKQNLEITIKSLGTLKADVLSAEADLANAELDLSHTRVLAPVDGQLGEVGVEAGQLLSAGSQITTITPKNAWIIANFKETQTANMRVGMPVTFTVDALDHKRMKGYISLISPATGSEFSAIKSNNATGNFTKVVQRIPVRIEIENNQDLIGRLRPGLSVIVTVDTTSPLLDPMPNNISDNDHPIVYD